MAGVIRTEQKVVADLSGRVALVRAGTETAALRVPIVVTSPSATSALVGYAVPELGALRTSSAEAVP